MTQELTLKRCSTCSSEKPLECFSKYSALKDGLRPNCKECCKEYYLKNRQKILKTKAQARLSNPQKFKNRWSSYYSTHAQQLRKRGIERYWKIKKDKNLYAEHLKKSAISVKKSTDRYPLRKKARNAARYAVATGGLIRPDSCAVCGKRCTPQAHHDSYEESQWLNVKWMCRSCHSEHHRKHND